MVDKNFPHTEHHTNWGLVLASILVAVGGVYLAYSIYGEGGMAKAEKYARSQPSLYYASLNRLYFDELFSLLFVTPLQMLAQLCRGVETFLGDIVRLVATLPKFLGEVFRPMQNGLVQFYSLSMVMGVAAFVGYLILWAGK
jgi:NADH:ubiquinone oxidoreductase subunit 5 (subunit L)/multisubunit Na+/H+ antiporter MnhA subunit